ncbi:MAG: hypothetical protein ABSD57_10630 [Verrucomicrobiota bacterium]|jgi:hypothetical protein
MSEIRLNNEKELIEEILRGKAYEEFRNEHLQRKIEREKRAWKLLEEHKGHYTLEILNRVFDTVDLYENNKRWFGQMLATPNRNWIFESGMPLINEWLNDLLFSGKEAKDALNTCLKKMKIKGASKGLATLLLYLSDPSKHNIWVNRTEEGLAILGRIGELKGGDWGGNYTQFNNATAEFRIAYKIQPQEIDWILNFIARFVESDDGRFRINEDTLDAEKIAIAVDDESDLDDIVGEPMELQVMRWTPTNEMGVVALFIEFRKELGFPIVEVIRAGFPDAAVFEGGSSKRHIRKYIEFEFKSSGYKAHLKSKRKCHYVVCWENDWKDCPIPVFELKQLIPPIIAKRNRS